MLPSMSVTINYNYYHQWKFLLGFQNPSFEVDKRRKVGCIYNASKHMFFPLTCNYFLNQMTRGWKANLFQTKDFEVCEPVPIKFTPINTQNKTLE